MRNYKSEYARETGERKAKRAARNRARYSLMKQGRVKKGDGQDVDHKNGNTLDNRPGNLRAMSRAANLARKRK
ncbi:MAG: hypothetical protein CMG46_13915 [Candidatus Marinimicrobia bacterium]|nr:hypothetical protein [Candidatus Neomarinimicrobiota bacterium]